MWRESEAEKNLLRTHTTAVSSKMLYRLAQVLGTSTFVQQCQCQLYGVFPAAGQGQCLTCLPACMVPFHAAYTQLDAGCLSPEQHTAMASCSSADARQDPDKGLEG